MSVCLKLSSSKDTDDHAVYVIAFGLCNNTTVEKFDLSHNNIIVNGMNKLSECIKHCTSINYVDLSENNSSPWGVYCAIIRYCHVGNLILYGDEGIKDYVWDIGNNLQGNLTLKSLTLCKVGSTGIQLIESILAADTALKELNLSWGSDANGTKIFKTQLKADNNEVFVNILYDDYHNCLSKTINLSSKDIDDDAAYVIAFGLCNNGTMEKLDLSHNNITVNGMKKLSKCIKHCISINYVDLSGNNFSPSGVYRTITENCCVNSLTLCGDKGMK